MRMKRVARSIFVSSIAIVSWIVRTFLNFIIINLLRIWRKVFIFIIVRSSNNDSLVIIIIIINIIIFDFYIYLYSLYCYASEKKTRVRM